MSSLVLQLLFQDLCGIVVTLLGSKGIFTSGRLRVQFEGSAVHCPLRFKTKSTATLFHGGDALQINLWPSSGHESTSIME